MVMALLVGVFVAMVAAAGLGVYLFKLWPGTPGPSPGVVASSPASSPHPSSATPQAPVAVEPIPSDDVTDGSAPVGPDETPRPVEPGTSPDSPTWGGQPLGSPDPVGEPGDIPGIERVSDREAVVGLARLEAPIPAEEVAAVVSGDWGFVDVAARDPRTGDWAQAVSGLYHRERGRWRNLEWGDPMEWSDYDKQMTPEELKAFEAWQGSHY